MEKEEEMEKNEEKEDEEEYEMIIKRNKLRCEMGEARGREQGASGALGKGERGGEAIEAAERGGGAGEGRKVGIVTLMNIK